MDFTDAISAVSETAGLLAIIPNPAPIDPTGGAQGTSDLLSYAKWGSLFASALVGLISGALWAFGGLSRRPDMADLGKKALICSFVGIIVAGTWIRVTNTVWIGLG
jgi:hypothetical protein